MTRRIALLAFAVAATGAGLLAPAAAHADACVTASESYSDSAAKVCVYDNGTVACGGHVDDTRFFCIL